MEDRFIVIGMAEEMITVIYTVRNGLIRIISARSATAKEKRMYYDGY